jgi:tetratricopeptide (TPR) repeat protein
MEKKRTSRPFWFNTLTVLNLPLSLLSALVMWMLVGPERTISGTVAFGMKPLAWFAPLEVAFENIFLALVPVGLLVVFYLCAYVLSFDRLAKARPFGRIILLHCGIVLPAAAALLAKFEIAAGPGVLILMVAEAAFPALAWSLERLVGRALLALTMRLLKREQYQLGNAFLAVAVLFTPGNADLMRALGVSRFETGDVVGAIDALEPLLTPDCKDTKMLEILEECYRTERHFEKALRIEKMILKDNPGDETARMRMARVLDDVNRLDEAIRVLGEGMPSSRQDYLELLLNLNLKADDVSAALEVVRALEALDPKAEKRAEQAYRRILESYPGKKQALEGLGKLLIRHGKNEEGYDLFEQVLAADSQRHDLRTRLVQYYQEQDDMAKAEPHLVALMDAGNQSEDIFLLYGNILTQHEEYDRALLHFQYAVEQFPNDYRFAFFLAQISFKTEALEDARRWCGEAESRVVNPQDQNRIKSLRAKIEQATTDRDLHILQERSRREPENIEMRLSLLESLCEHGMADKAVGEYDALLSGRPELRQRVIKQIEKFSTGSKQNFRLMDYLADLKIAEGLWDAAFELACKMADRSLQGDPVLSDRCRRILRHAPDHIPSLRKLGDICRRQQKWDETAEIYGKLLDLGVPEVGECRKALFEACTHLHRPDQALKIALELIKEHPRDMQMRLQIVQLYAAGNRFDEAFEHLQIAQSQDYYDAEVVRMMQELKAQKRTYRLESLLQTIEKEPGNTTALMEAGDLYGEMGETKKAISCYQRVGHDAALKDRAGVKLARAMTQLRMFDLAEETLDEVNLRSDDTETEAMLKRFCYDVAEAFREEAMHDRALKFYKKIFRVDAAFRDVVDKIETLSD